MRGEEEQRHKAAPVSTVLVQEREKRLQAMAGPALTVACVLGVLGGFGYLLLHHARDRVSACLKTVAACSAAMAILMCLLCHLVDPGTPEPNPEDPGPVDEFDDTQRIRERRLPSGTRWKQKWCRQCRLWRPHRCGHCSFCGRCVLRLDHHCFWMGTCIGERNMRFFVGLLLSAGTGLVALAVLAVHRIGMLGCWDRPERWVQTWEPLCIALVFCCCPPVMCLVCGTVFLPVAGLGYAFVILLDLDVQEQQDIDGIKFMLETLSALRRCSGPCTYCCGPLALKAPVRVGPAPAQDRSHSSAHEPGTASPASSELLAEVASLPGSLPDVDGYTEPEGP